MARAFASLMMLGVVAFGSRIEAGEPRHLLYLHGRIVQETQSARPRHARFGYYELEEILAAFRTRGFVVTGEIRPRSSSLDESADRVAKQVRALLDSGVAVEDVSVVGGSMGAAIAMLASMRIREPRLRYALLGACMTGSVAQWAAEDGRRPVGRFLAIREKSDELSEPCTPWSGDGGGLFVREIVVETGLAHGFLYRPLPEWLDPVAEWAAGGPRR